MDLLEAIRTRRSVRKVLDELPDKQLIETVLDAAKYAPNHRNTEPWRFTVLTGGGRDRLGRVLGALNQEKLAASADSGEREAAMQAGLEKARRAPVVIVVTVEPSPLPAVVESEETAAVSCAVENMLLTAHSLGLGAIWRTGAPAYAAAMKKQFGASDHSSVLGFIYIGYPDHSYEPAVPERKAIHELTQWIEA
ncbi:MAG: nitroreductase [Sporolactobacillus sp.]